MTKEKQQGQQTGKFKSKVERDLFGDREPFDSLVAHRFMVSRVHVLKGIPLDCRHCAGALALPTHFTALSPDGKCQCGHFVEDGMEDTVVLATRTYLIYPDYFIRFVNGQGLHEQVNKYDPSVMTLTVGGDKDFKTGIYTILAPSHSVRNKTAKGRGEYTGTGAPRSGHFDRLAGVNRLRAALQEASEAEYQRQMSGS